MMRILHIITALNVGGAERVLYNLLSGGLQGSFENEVISMMDMGHYGPLLREAGIPVTCLNINSTRPRPSAVWQLRRIVRDVKPNIVQGWMYHGNLAASLARGFAGHRTSLSWNIRLSREKSDHIKISTNAMVRIGGWLSAGPDAIVYNSSRARAQHEAEGYSPGNAHMIPNGFDTGIWKPDQTAGIRLRQELGLAPDAIVIGFVARAHTQKDLPNLFSAFAEVARKTPDCHLVCVGRGLTEAAPSDLDRGRVSFLGQRTDLPRIVPAFDLLCLSSLAEAFPNAVGEAMACGVPCVTTDVGDAAAIVGETGWVVPPLDNVALANGLLQALMLAEDERRMRGLAARRRIEDHYSSPSIISRYETLYSKLLEKA